MKRAAKKRGKRIVPIARDVELRAGLLEVAAVCRKYGIRLAALETWSSIAVYDALHKRPDKFPVAAFVNEIGNGKLKRLRIQSIMPEDAGK